MPYQPYQGPTTDPRFGYSNESDPRKLAANQRSVVQSTGDNLMSADQQLANEYAQQASGVENYLDPIETNLAAGNGGYNQNEASQIQLSPGDKSQIEYSPQDVQGIVNSAGVTAGQQTAANVNDAERSAAASGGSPAALATYRARAAQTGALNTANAMTAARVAAKNAQSGAAATSAQLESAGGQAVGNARLGQQQQGLGYESGLQQEKNSNALSEQGLQQGAYGTQTTGTGQAADIGLKASQTPTTTDKIIGAAAGVASAAALADGISGYLDDGQDAIVGEDGMEAVINNAPDAVMAGASNPVRSDTRYMDNGTPGAPPAPASVPTWLAQYLQNVGKNQNQQPSSSGPSQPWNKTTPYQQLGSAIGKIANRAMQPSSKSATGNAAPPSQGYVLPTSALRSSQAPSVTGVVPGTSSDALGPNAHPLLNRTGTPMGDAAPDQMPAFIDSGTEGAAAAGDGVMDMADAAPIGDAVGEGIGDLAGAFAADGRPHMADGQSGGGIGNYLADGSDSAMDAPWTDQGVSMQADGSNGMQVGRAQIFTKPTMVHLNKPDSVVPLTYRAKAKVRPSSALPAMMGRPMQGGVRNAA